MIVIVTPYPPTVNHYYGNGRNGAKFIKPQGKAYRLATKQYVELHKICAPQGRLQVAIQVYPPDKRRRDLDNCAKAALDALQHAGVYADDCLIDDLRFVRMPPTKGGMLRVFISTFIPQLEQESFDFGIHQLEEMIQNGN